jgi:hypothetical protein
MFKDFAPSMYQLYLEEGVDNLRVVKLNEKNPDLMSGFSSFQLHSASCIRMFGVKIGLRM